MKFEYDENKSQIHKEKHGIDFVDAEKNMKKITAKEFDKKFDNGEDINEHLDFSSAIRLKDVKKLKTPKK